MQPSDEQAEIDWAQKYISEPWRVTHNAGAWLFWDNCQVYAVQLRDGQLRCDCEAWAQKPRGSEGCKHTRALELMRITNLVEEAGSEVPSGELLAALHPVCH